MPQEPIEQEKHARDGGNRDDVIAVYPRNRNKRCQRGKGQERAG
jgi:hypothetical protein